MKREARQETRQTRDRVSCGGIRIIKVTVLHPINFFSWTQHAEKSSRPWTVRNFLLCRASKE